MGKGGGGGGGLKNSGGVGGRSSAPKSTMNASSIMAAAKNAKSLYDGEYVTIVQAYRAFVRKHGMALGRLPEFKAAVWKEALAGKIRLVALDMPQTLSPADRADREKSFVGPNNNYSAIAMR